jgi:hypothetical protein
LYIRYDGGAIGTYLGDAIRDITGSTSIRAASGGQIELFGDGAQSGAFVHHLSGSSTPALSAALGTSGKYMGVHFSAGLVVPIANENRPASISVYACITY